VRKRKIDTKKDAKTEEYNEEQENIS